MSYHTNDGGGGDADNEQSTWGTWGKEVAVNGDSEARPTLVDCFVGAGDYRCRLVERISSGSFGDVYRYLIGFRVCIAPYEWLMKM